MTKQTTITTPRAIGTVPPLSLKVARKLYPVETYAEASEKVLAALAKYQGYYRDLPEITLHEGGRKVGHVSTNGKVWLRRGGDDYQVWPPRTDLPPLEVTAPPAGTVAAALAAKPVEASAESLAEVKATRRADGSYSSGGVGRFRSAELAAKVLDTRKAFAAKLDAAGPKGSPERRAAFLAHFGIKAEA